MQRSTSNKVTDAPQRDQVTLGAVVAQLLSKAQESMSHLAQSRSGLSYYNADGLGSVTSLTDSSGAPTATFVYGAFGVLNSSTGTTANSYRYTAREYDAETGLYYYRARYYDSSAGRFINEDPIGFIGGANFFRYVGNSPLVLIDPTGLQGGMGPGKPPIAVPGAPDAEWVWTPNPQNGRGGTYTPSDYPATPNGSKPSVSWEHVGRGKPGAPGHWDLDLGNGTRKRFDRWGNEISPEQAHGSKCERIEDDWWANFGRAFNQNYQDHMIRVWDNSKQDLRDLLDGLRNPPPPPNIAPYGPLQFPWWELAPI